MPPSFFGGVSGVFVRVLTFLSIVVLFSYLELQFGLDGFLKFNIHMKTGSLHSAIKPATNDKLPKVKARRKLRRKMSRMNLDNKKKDTKSGEETKSKSKRWVTLLVNSSPTIRTYWLFRLFFACIIPTYIGLYTYKLALDQFL